MYNIKMGSNRRVSYIRATMTKIGTVKKQIPIDLLELVLDAQFIYIDQKNPTLL